MKLAILRRKNASGFTLIELIITIAVLAIVVTYGFTAVTTSSDKRKLKGITQLLHQDMRFARSEAIKRNQEITVAFQDPTADGSQWCYGISLGTGTCNCNTTPAGCAIDGTVHVRSYLKYEGVTLSDVSTADNAITFDPLHGEAEVSTISYVSDQDVEAYVQTTALGRVRVCSPSASTNKYGFNLCN